jgi:tetratricopeptide (TPR) repeat protein
MTLSPTHFAVLIVALTAACSDSSEPGSPSPARPAEFIGSSACESCHTTQYQDWLGSHHELAMQVADSSTVLADFNSTEFEYFDAITYFFTRDGEYYVRTADGRGQQQDYRVAYTFGVYPLQQYLVEFPGGRLQSLPFSWDTRTQIDGGQRWFHLYGDEYIGPGDELHWTGRNQNWNFMCAECHSTNLVMGYAADTHSFNTTYSEISVGCEACHGPATSHIDQAKNGAFDTGYGLLVDLDDQRGTSWIMDTDSGIAARDKPHSGSQQQPESCGRCHARRGVITATYEYGKPLADTHMPALLDERLYFADGQIKDEVYVYGSFVQSKMYRAGVTCSDCHNPHSGKLVAGPDPDAVCTQCHLPSVFDTTAHHEHQSTEVGCVDCHMPERTYMGVDDRRDHNFRIPRPGLSAQLDAPLACANCHTDAEIESFAQPAIGSHYGLALAAGRTGSANATLVDAIRNDNTPDIARATALTLITAPADAAEESAIAASVASPSALVRIGALRALRLYPADTRLILGGDLLADPVRGVRLEAVSLLADVHDLLPAKFNINFGVAAEEYRGSYLATANRPASLASLASFEANTGNTTVAVPYMERAVQLAPENADLRHSMGLLYVRSGNQQAALEQFRLAAEYDPANSRYVYVFGVALNSLGQPAEALAVLDAARIQFPDNFDIGWAVVTMRRDRGEREIALRVLDELRSQFPGNRDLEALRQSLLPLTN